MHSRGICIRLGVLSAVTALLLSSFPLQAQKLAKVPASSQKALKQLDLPLTFEANQGQSDGRVRFLARGAGYGLFLTQNEAVLAVSKPVAKGGAKGLARPALEDRASVELVSGSRSTPVQIGR